MPKEVPHNYINNHGGLDILTSHFATLNIWQKMDGWLGARNARAEYSYSDAIQTWVFNMIAGSRRLEHSYDNKDSLAAHPKFGKGMSPDTISRTLKNLAVENEYYTKTKGDSRKKENSNRLISNPTKAMMINGNEVNDNKKLNELVFDTALVLGLFKEGEAYELDIDATIIPTKVSDSRVHYKCTGTGYCPMVVVLGGIPIFMESRNGNSSPAFRVLDVLKNAIELFESRNIGIKFVRIDAAGSTEKIIKYLCERDILFYIRAKATNRGKMENDYINWNQSDKHDHLDVAENSLSMAGYNLMLVDYRNKYSKDANGDQKVFGIITNDFYIDQDDVVSLYNQRGAIEQRFADLKEMGWHYMVHRELKYNTVHMHMTLLAYVFFLYSKKWLASKVSFIKENIKPKTFIRTFIRVVTKWTDVGLEFISRQKDFELLRV